MYLEEKVGVYRELKVDFTKVGSEKGGGRLRKLSVAKGLLREVKTLQRQLETLLNCKVCYIYINILFLFYIQWNIKMTLPFLVLCG
jgi:hypothetical protein